MIRGLVSTIIPVFNRPLQVAEAVSSVLAQSYEAIEVIVVDDGSDEPLVLESLNIGEHRSRDRVQLFRQPNRGPGAARQHGLLRAQGEFVQFLDSDDVLLERKFELQTAELQERPDAGACYGKTRYREEGGQVVAPWRRTGERIGQMFPSMLAARWWGTSTPLYRRTVMDRAGPICSLRNEEDWEFDCRVAALGTRLAWVDEWVSEQRAGASNRASAGGSTEPLKLADRAMARHLILDSALAAGVPADSPEFGQFSRSSFLLARQCAAAGLGNEAERLVRRIHSISPRAATAAFLGLGGWLGMKRTAALLEGAYRLMRGGRVAGIE